jgi:glycosyltransferase involved in cell wall biosynthesis
MRVSVVIPARNEVKTLPLLLHDLAATRKAGHEIVVVDGGSDDDTVEIATPYADKVLRCAPGRAQQLNTGAKAATGDVLWFLHADSRVFSGTLEALLGFDRQHTIAGADSMCAYLVTSGLSASSRG